MTSQPDEPTLADVQREYPTWRSCRSISGVYHARPADAQPGDPASVTGEDPLDLRDQIRRAQAAREEQDTR